MKSRIIFNALFCFLLLAQMPAVAQRDNYPIPLNWKSAIDQSTRTLNGIPGRNYWQNQARYQLYASLDVKKSMLKGQGTITYFNNSPDTLDRLVFNLYQDIFRKGNARDWDLGTADLHDGTQLRLLKWGSVNIKPDDNTKVNRLGTKLIVRPGMKIPPGDSVLVEMQWEVPLPTQRTVRMGKFSDSIVFVAYWYPQIAVYDDIDGWDMISYGGSVEFYNDFNDYDVSISVPKSYVVWATGELSNSAQIFQPEIVDRISRASSSDKVTRIIDVEDYNENRVFRKRTPGVFRFKAKAVPDFSFGVGKGLVWDAVAVSTDNEGSSILAHAVYNKGARHWDKVAYFSRLSIEYMSKQMPGIPFPYQHMTTMHNGKAAGGMETPMMAINGAPSALSGNFGLTFHEIAHTYMPFYMGINEKKYAWMDEGWATLWPHYLADSLFPEEKYLEKLMRGYEKVAGSEYDIPPMVPNHFMSANYATLRLGSYVRPAAAYYFLEHTLGKDLFKSALKHYMAAWNGKHPIPLDFFNAFESATDSDLFWFFEPWFYEYAYPDLSLRKITADNQLVVENTGKLPLPVYIKITFVDDSIEEISLKADVWHSGNRTLVVPLKTNAAVREVELGKDWIPDVNRKDNRLIIID
ncbi:MAG TPA: M1 family metallopeptidase [Bacteroidales bacterium]|nr:M1 family metallopeptidase [Bacteroidales bacterium]